MLKTLFRKLVGFIITVSRTRQFFINHFASSDKTSTQLYGDICVYVFHFFYEFVDSRVVHLATIDPQKQQTKPHTQKPHKQEEHQVSYSSHIPKIAAAHLECVLFEDMHNTLSTLSLYMRLGTRGTGEEDSINVRSPALLRMRSTPKNKWTKQNHKRFHYGASIFIFTSLCTNELRYANA